MGGSPPRTFQVPSDPDDPATTLRPSLPPSFSCTSSTACESSLAGSSDSLSTVGGVGVLNGHSATASVRIAAVTASPSCVMRSPHDVLLIMKQRIPHPTRVVSLELDIERIH